MILRVKNWREFQHYSKRNPPWIKLHHRLLDDRAFLTLPVESRALAPMLWLIASENEGEIRDAINEITFRLRMREQDARDALAPLLAGGFFTCEQDDSATASTPDSAPLATLLTQTETETETETEAETEERGARARDPEPQPEPDDGLDLPQFLDKHPGATHAQRIPDDWWPTADLIAFAQGEGLDAVRTAENFRDYWRSASGSNARKRDWSAAFRVWCRRQVGQQPTRPAGGVRSAATGGEAAAFARAAARLGSDEPVQ